MKHKHAHHMAEYAKDALETETPYKLWQARINPTGGETPWGNATNHPLWSKGFEYRRKPKTVNISGHEIEAPVYAVPVCGVVFVVDPRHKTLVGEYATGDPCVQTMVDRGIVHLSRKNAEAHANALLSFTTRGKQ